MGVTIIKGTEVTRPDTTPLTSTLFDHATVVENASFGLRNNAGLWPSYNCLDLLTPTQMCPEPQVGSKVFHMGAWQPAFDFAVYGGVQCKALGLDKEDQFAEVKRVFGESEAKGVEQALLYSRLAADYDGSVEPPLPWDAPVVVSTGKTLSQTLAMLIGHAAANYVGQPTIHMPRAAAELLGDRIVWVGGKAYTRTGAKVAVGGGYDDPDMLASGNWDLYATGEVYVERSEQIEVQQYVVPGDGSGTGSDENGLAPNTVVAMAERMYRVAVDCYTAKATAAVFS